MSYDLGLELKAISECSLYNHLNYCNFGGIYNYNKQVISICIF